MAKGMLNGDDVPWRMTSEITVWSMGIPFSISIDKQTVFPPIELTNYATSNLEMSHGNTTTNQLVIDADVSFYSSSPMRLEGFGTIKAELYYSVAGNDPDLSPEARLRQGGPPIRDDHVKIGECHMYDYRVEQGMNTIQTKIFLDANYATGQSLGRWASEFDQTIVSVGPTNISPFIDGIWEGANDMPGSSITLYTATFVTADTLGVHAPKHPPRLPVPPGTQLTAPPPASPQSRATTQRRASRAKSGCARLACRPPPACALVLGAYVPSSHIVARRTGASTPVTGARR